MPEEFALHVTYALALDGVGDDYCRERTIGFKEVDGLGYFIIVVAVDFDDIPVEGTEFVG